MVKPVVSCFDFAQIQHAAPQLKCTARCLTQWPWSGLPGSHSIGLSQGPNLPSDGAPARGGRTPGWILAAPLRAGAAYAPQHELERDPPGDILATSFVSSKHACGVGPQCRALYSPLQGFNLVSYNAAISMAQSVLDAAGTAMVLQWPRAWYSGTLTGVGIVSVANAAAACIAGMLAAAVLT